MKTKSSVWTWTWTLDFGGFVNRAVLPKPKLIDYIGRFQKLFLNLTTTPKLAPKDQKIAPKGLKSAKVAPNVAKLKAKK